jgi:hypothetical protein
MKRSQEIVSRQNLSSIHIPSGCVPLSFDGILFCVQCFCARSKQRLPENSGSHGAKYGWNANGTRSCQERYFYCIKTKFEIVGNLLFEKIWINQNLKLFVKNRHCLKFRVKFFIFHKSKIKINIT